MSAAALLCSPELQPPLAFSLVATMSEPDGMLRWCRAFFAMRFIVSSCAAGIETASRFSARASVAASAPGGGNIDSQLSACRVFTWRLRSARCRRCSSASLFSRLPRLDSLSTSSGFGSKGTRPEPAIWMRTDCCIARIEVNVNEGLVCGLPPMLTSGNNPRHHIYSAHTC